MTGVTRMSGISGITRMTELTWITRIQMYLSLLD